jgi:hypothetical protein
VELSIHAQVAWKRAQGNHQGAPCVNALFSNASALCWWAVSTWLRQTCTDATAAKLDIQAACVSTVFAVVQPVKREAHKAWHRTPGGLLRQQQRGEVDHCPCEGVPALGHLQHLLKSLRTPDKTETLLFHLQQVPAVTGAGAQAWHTPQS